MLVSFYLWQAQSLLLPRRAGDSDDPSAKAARAAVPGPGSGPPRGAALRAAPLQVLIFVWLLQVAS